ncbi:hypothetical protein ACOSQ3_031805 [Xanthoceras sorbifolium]
MDYNNNKNLLNYRNQNLLNHHSSLIPRPEIFDGVSFDGRSLVEWNIDGQFEYQIMQTLKHIMMYAQLINLKCQTLSNFRWYKSVFFSKVFQRKDYSMNFWKKKFLAGLPALFAERVRTSIKNKYGGSILWHMLTYGDISSEIVATGLAICTEQKLQRKMDKGSTKKTIGDFCEQYGYNESSSKPPKHRSTRPASPATTKQALPEFSDKMKRYMKKFLLSDSDEEDEIDYIDDISDTSSDSEFAESSSSSEEEEQFNCDHYKSILKLNGLSINMLRKEDSLILDCIDAINDPVRKRSVMEQ